MQINVLDRSQLRVITDAIVAGGYDTYKHPLGVYFNDRVLNNARLKRPPKHARASELVKPTNRGYAMQYYCPVCGRMMWCTLIDTKQPAITCRKCTSDEVEMFFGSTIAERASWAYTTLLSENYDPLLPGESTLPGGVCNTWRREPIKFVQWMTFKLEQALLKTRYSGRPVWLVASGKQWDTSAKITREDSPRGARVKIV